MRSTWSVTSKVSINMPYSATDGMWTVKARSQDVADEELYNLCLTGAFSRSDIRVYKLGRLYHS